MAERESATTLQGGEEVTRLGLAAPGCLPAQSWMRSRPEPRPFWAALACRRCPSPRPQTPLMLRHLRAYAPQLGAAPLITCAPEASHAIGHEAADVGVVQRHLQPLVVVLVCRGGGGGGGAGGSAGKFNPSPLPDGRHTKGGRQGAPSPKTQERCSLAGLEILAPQPSSCLARAACYATRHGSAHPPPGPPQPTPTQRPFH